MGYYEYISNTTTGYQSVVVRNLILSDIIILLTIIKFRFVSGDKLF